MSNILRKQNQMINMTPPSDAYDVTYGNTTVGDELDKIKTGKKVNYFNVTVPSGSSNYDYSSERPSNFANVISAISIGGAGAVIMQATGSRLFFSSALTGASTIRIFYEML